MYKLLNQKGLVISSLVGVAILAIALVSSSVDFALRGSYFLMFVAAIAGLGLPLYFALDDPKKLIKTGVSIGVVGVLFLIIYAASTSEVLPHYLALGVTEGEVQFSGAMISTMIVMVILAVVSVVVTEVYNIFKK